MYFKRTREFQLLLATLILSIALLIMSFTEPALAQGKLITDTITSPSLEGNLLGDSATKDLTIYLPPSYDTSDKRYPVAYYLPGWGNVTFNPSWDDPFVSSDDVPEGGLDGMFDDMIAAGDMKEMIIVIPEGNNKYGGSMYTNSDVTGNHEAYIVQDVVSYIDAHYRTIPSRDSRAIGGASMGGYGAMKLAMKHPDLFGAVAAHGPFLYFEGLKPIVALAFEENPDGMTGPSVDKIATSMTYAASAAFSPNTENPPFYVDLPFEYPSPEIIGEVWDRWLEHDPFTMLPTYGDNLASLRGIYFEAGDKDEYGFNYHVEAFHEALTAVGIEHEYVIFDGGHSDTLYDRLPISLSFLSDKLVSDADLEANKAVSLRRFELYNQRNIDALDEIFTVDSVDHDPTTGDTVGLEARKQVAAGLIATYPDVHWTVDDQVAQGDLVATSITLNGTLPETELPWTVTGIAIDRFVDGKIAETWTHADYLGAAEQTGEMPRMRDSYEWGEPSDVTGDPGNPTTNIEIIRRVIEEIWNQGNTAVSDELVHPDYIYNEPGNVRIGIDLFKDSVIEYRSAFPDLHVSIDKIFAEDDKVVASWTFTGTHTGTPFKGFPTTGKSFGVQGININRIADGKLVESWWCVDHLSLLMLLSSATTEEINKAVRTRLYEEINKHNLDIIDEVYADDYVGDLGVVENKEVAKQTFTAYFAAFPDLHFTADDMIAEGDLIATRWTATSTHKGEFMGIPPTNKQNVVTGIVITHMVNGKIKQLWENMDELGMMQQLGVIPADREVFSWGEPLEITGDPGDPNVNKGIVLRLITEVWNQGNLDVADELLHPDHFINEAGYPMRRGIDVYKEAVAEWHSDLPDLNLKTDLIFAEGDKVVTRWTMTGTHTGTDITGLPATGKRLEVTGITIIRIADGKAVESWWVLDRMGVMTQLTAEPTEDFSNVFFTSLEPGLNMISLPLKPQTPYTARSFAEELSATVVVKLDEGRQRFVGFTLDAPDDGFAIEGGKGYIVNVPEAKVVTFTGAAWTNNPPVEASPSRTQSDGAWAYVVSGILLDDSNDSLNKKGYLVNVRNTRTNAVATDVVRAGYFAAAFADLSRKDVVQVGDRLEIQVRDKSGEIASETFTYTVTPESIHQAFLPIILKNVGIPRQSLLLQNYPNPFNPETWIPYQIRESAEVVIHIYNTQGRLVRTLDLGQHAAGFYIGHARAAYWNGRNEAGEKIASGIYFYHLQADDFSSTRRMIILK